MAMVAGQTSRGHRPSPYVHLMSGVRGVPVIVCKACSAPHTAQPALCMGAEAHEPVVIVQQTAEVWTYEQLVRSCWPAPESQLLSSSHCHAGVLRLYLACRR